MFDKKLGSSSILSIINSQNSMCLSKGDFLLVTQSTQMSFYLSWHSME